MPLCTIQVCQHINIIKWHSSYLRTNNKFPIYIHLKVHQHYNKSFALYTYINLYKNQCGSDVVLIDYTSFICTS